MFAVFVHDIFVRNVIKICRMRAVIGVERRHDVFAKIFALFAQNFGDLLAGMRNISALSDHFIWHVFRVHNRVKSAKFAAVRIRQILRGFGDLFAAALFVGKHHHELLVWQCGCQKRFNSRLNHLAAFVIRRHNNNVA